MVRRLESRRLPDWQVRLVEPAIPIGVVNSPKRPDWLNAAWATPEPHGQVDPLALCAVLRRRLRTRHDSHRPERRDATGRAASSNTSLASRASLGPPAEPLRRATT